MDKLHRPRVLGTVGGAANIDLSVNPCHWTGLGIKQGRRPCPASTPPYRRKTDLPGGLLSRKWHLNSIQRPSSSSLLLFHLLFFSPVTQHPHSKWHLSPTACIPRYLHSVQLQ